MNDIIKTLIIIGLVAVAILVLILIVKHFLEKTAHTYLGMSAKQAGKMLSDGLKNEVNLPKPITSLTNIYMPALLRDFPDLSAEGIQQQAKNALLSAFNAIEAQNPDLAQNASDNLTRQLENRIRDNTSGGFREYFDKVTIHKYGIADYKSDKRTATVRFELSLECLHYAKMRGKVTDPSKTNTPEQSVWEVVLSYNQDAKAMGESHATSMNCPNCGAPIAAIGDKKVCQYCGAGLEIVQDKVWLAESFRQIA